MPVEARPLFRPDVLRPHLVAFQWPANLPAIRERLARWAELFASRRADKFKEKELLPDFLTDVFCDVLGYSRPADHAERYTFSREKHVQVDGKFADAVLGSFRPGREEFIVALEGKGPMDPLDRPFAGRKMSAVDQGYRYAINLPADWIIVTSMRQTRLYHKGSDQYTFERFDIERLVEDDSLLKRFLFLLGAERVAPESGLCHLYGLLSSSEKVGKELTREFYGRYAEMRQNAFHHLCRENPALSRFDLLSATQKLLDRILFVAFCEDRGLLPPETIQRAYEHRDPYHPQSVPNTPSNSRANLNGHDIPRRAKQGHGAGSEQGHFARTDCAVDGSPHGLSVPASSSRLARHARSGISRTPESHLHSWMLLASA